MVPTIEQQKANFRMSGGSKVALGVALICSIGYASAADIVGKASVIDGNTIEIHG
jgi:hypothetical protein